MTFRSLCAALCVALTLGVPLHARWQKTALGRNGMVVSADSLATAVGVEILRKGGNAVDAGVAVGFALAVTFPIAGNIGGGGFMVIRLADGRSTTIDFREKAPRAATRDMFLNGKGEFVSARSQMGPLASGVPGSVAGLLDALEHYGTMKRAAVLQPAIDLARQGFVIRNRFLAREIVDRYPTFSRFPASLPVFGDGRKPKSLGDTLTQPDLAETLQRIKESGRDGFYRGTTAARIIAEMQKYGGILDHEDLTSYAPVERPPVKGSYRGFEVLSMGPPSSGGVVLIEMLNILEGFDVKKNSFFSPASTTLMAETMKVAYADRAEFLGDPDFVAVPVERLLSKKYAAVRRKLVSSHAARPSSKVSAGVIPPQEHTETTHLSIVDRWGNCVSMTTTINDFFGCGLMVEGGGFFLNNEMDDFSAKPGTPNQFGLVGGSANAIEPKKRMLSAMAPTIVLRGDKPFLVVGTPGGSRIITTIFQILVNVVDYKMGLQKAIDAPRVHHQWKPDSLFFERGGLSSGIRKEMRKRGYKPVELKGEYGRAEGIMVGEDGLLTGVTDRRGNGAAHGY